MEAAATFIVATVSSGDRAVIDSKIASCNIEDGASSSQRDGIIVQVKRPGVAGNGDGAGCLHVLEQCKRAAVNPVLQGRGEVAIICGRFAAGHAGNGNGKFARLDPDVRLSRACIVGIDLAVVRAGAGIDRRALGNGQTARCTVVVAAFSDSLAAPLSGGLCCHSAAEDVDFGNIAFFVISAVATADRGGIA